MTQYSNSQSNPAAAIPVWIAPPSGQVLTNIVTEAGILVKTGSGVLAAITVNQAQANGTVEVVDGIDGTGTVLGTLSLAAQNTIPLGWSFKVGLFLITTGTGGVNITASSI